MIWLLLIALCVVAAIPFVLEQRKPDMDDAVRAQAPGQFAQLSDGNTHYQWHGPANRPVLVCIHGLTTPSFVWDRLLPHLTQAGFRVLTYDLYGRGWSDRPKGAQTRSFFMRQLRDLLQDQAVEGPVSVFGYSMGGSIAAVFAAEEPDRIERLILLAPAGIAYRPGRLAEFIRLGGRTGAWTMLTFGARSMRRAALANPNPDGFGQRQAAELDWRGYLPAVLSSQRNLLSERLDEEHRNLHALGVPVLAIWGETDDVIPLSAMGKLAEWNRDAKQATVANAGHALGVTHPEDVTEALSDLLQA